MKILLIGPIHKRKDFLQSKREGPFLKGQAQQSWYEALKRLGHNVVVYRNNDPIILPAAFSAFIARQSDSLLPRWKARLIRKREQLYMVDPEVYIRSLTLLKRAVKIKPDVILVSGSTPSIVPSILQLIKNKTGAKTVLMSGTDPDIASIPIERGYVANGPIDVVVCNDSGFCKKWKEKYHAKRVLVLPISSIDPNLHNKVSLTVKEKKEYGCDVSFVGMLYNERQEILKLLLDFNIAIWGQLPVGTKLKKELTPVYRGQAYGEKMVKIFNASKISLNIHATHMKYGGNMRTFEICGAGTLQLIDNLEPEWFRDKKEIVVFKDARDLRKKISYYLSHESERKKIAEAGYKRAHKDHTYDKRLEQLLKLL